MNHHLSLNSTVHGSGGTCLQGGRMPTVPEEGGFAGDGASPGQAGFCWVAEGL